MTQSISFQQVDVFTKVPFKGNPVAVVLDGDHLSAEQMQEIANWTNLSETTFVCSPSHPDADYKLRIFTPNNELPFAGHPTLGSAHALLKNGLQPKNKNKIIQECGLGLVEIFTEKDKLFFELPKPKITEIDEHQLEQIADALQISIENVLARQTIDVGAKWMTLQLTSAELVSTIEPNQEKLSSLIPAGCTGVTIFGAYPDHAETEFEVRGFAPNEGVPEDPVCGSGNGCVATMVKNFNLLSETSYVASQGHCVGRDGRIEVRFPSEESTLIGGHAVTCIEGNLTI